MSIVTTIRNRRSIYDFKPDPPSKEVIAEILDCAVWAPNHKVTEPWRFLVVSGSTKQKLADVYRKVQVAKVKSDDPSILAVASSKGYEKLMSKPALIGVTCRRDEDPFRAREDYASACCAIHNISLAGWEKGIGFQWSTSALVSHPEAMKLLRVDTEQEEVIGFLYAGYPAEIPDQTRIPASELTTWFD